MDKKIFLPLIIFVVIILGSVIVYKNNQNNEIDNRFADDNIGGDAFERPTETITANYQFKDGKHVFIGKVPVSNPCTNLNTDIKRNENEVEIEISTEYIDVTCADQISEKQFDIIFEGEQDDLIIASLNGQIVNLNIFVISDGEDTENLNIIE